MRVLVAPDKFRGTLTARQAAAAIEAGWRAARPDDVVDAAPMADGGEGTLEVLLDAMGGTTVEVEVRGPLGDRTRAPLGLVDVADGPLGIVETARASGIQLLSRARWDPRRATTRGSGELIRAAMDRGARHLIVGLGGSATNDGGAGMARALGVRFLDERGAELSDGGAALLRLARIDVSELDPRLRAVVVEGAADVDNLLTGLTGASVVFGPRKGASQEDVWELDRAMAHLAATVHRELGVDLRDVPGAGAAGGLGFGLLAFCGARVRGGVEIVGEAIDLETRVAQADLVITGEGTLDEPSLRGKVAGGVMALARIWRVPVAVVCGRADVIPAEATVRSLVERVGERSAMEDARGSLQLVARELAQTAGDLAGRAP
jgi:glycerate kinase